MFIYVLEQTQITPGKKHVCKAGKCFSYALLNNRVYPYVYYLCRKDDKISSSLGGPQALDTPKLVLY